MAEIPNELTTRVRDIVARLTGELCDRIEAESDRGFEVLMAAVANGEDGSITIARAYGISASSDPVLVKKSWTYADHKALEKFKLREIL